MSPINLRQLERKFVRGYLRWGKQKYPPFSVNVEPTNACNLSCPICPHGAQHLVNRKGQRTIGFMDMDTFRAVIDGCGNHTKTIALYLHGEPFLNKHFGDMIALARENDITVTVFSNGMTKGILNKIANVLHEQPKTLSLSMDLISRRGYLAYKGVDGYKQACENLTAIAELCSASDIRTRLSLRSIYNGESKKEVKAYLDRFLNISGLQDVQVTHPFPWPGTNNANVLAGRLVLENKEICPQVENALNICWDGTVVPCSFDYDATFPIGNIHNAPLDKILNSKKARQFRRLHILGKRHTIPLCKNCVLPRFLTNIITVRQKQYQHMTANRKNNLIKRIVDLTYNPLEECPLH